jgi:hypothetical protein
VPARLPPPLSAMTRLLLSPWRSPALLSPPSVIYGPKRVAMSSTNCSHVGGLPLLGSRWYHTCASLSRWKVRTQRTCSPGFSDHGSSIHSGGSTAVGCRCRRTLGIRAIASRRARTPSSPLVSRRRHRNSWRKQNLGHLIPSCHRHVSGEWVDSGT